MAVLISGSMTQQPHNTCTSTLTTRASYALRAFCCVLWLSLLVPAAAYAQVAATQPVFSPQERELKPGEVHSYRLPLTAGQFFYALVEQKQVDLNVALFTPDNQLIAETDSPNDRWGTEPVLLLADKPGDYRIEIRSPTGQAAGRYAIAIVASRDATSADKDLVRAQRLSDD